MQLFGQRQHGLTVGFRRDRGVQMGEVAVPGQLGLAAAARGQSVAAQLVGDGFHHQFMFAAVLVGAQQLRSGIPLPRRAGQGIAAQPTSAQAQQPFRRCTEEGIPRMALPEEAAASGLLLPEPFQQRQGVEGVGQNDAVPHRQHQFVQLAVVDQVNAAGEGCGVALPPGVRFRCRHQRLGLERGWAGRRLEQLVVLEPELFRQFAAVRCTAHNPVQPQPAPASLPAELPAGQHRLHRWHHRFAAAAFTHLIEEAKAQQHPRPRMGRTVCCGVVQAAEAEISKALGLLKSPAARQLQFLARPCCGQAKARGAVPQHLQAFLLRQLRQGQKRVDPLDRQGQTEQCFIAVTGHPPPLGCGEEGAETTISRHPRRFRPGLLLKCMGLRPAETGPVHV